MVRSALLCVLLFSAAALLVSVRAQDAGTPRDSVQSWYEGAWTHIVSSEGVHFGYIFYSEADNENNGVVVRLQNENEVEVRYAFTIIFRSPESETTAHTRGILQPGEMKTGEGDGLFWIPFRGGQRISEVGLRNIEVSPLDDG